MTAVQTRAPTEVELVICVIAVTGAVTGIAALATGDWRDHYLGRTE